VPVHGELRHMAEHARLAKSLQVPQALVPSNGQLYRLAPGPAELIDEVPSGRIFLDGRVLVAEGEGLTKTRRAMAYAGLIAITLVLDGKGRIAAAPAILIEGIPEPVHEAVRTAVEEMIARHKKGDADHLSENVRRAARRAAQDAWGKKPITRVTMVEL
jgi:ribonuclease J